MTRALIVIDMQRGFDDLDFWGDDRQSGLRGECRRAGRRLGAIG